MHFATNSILTLRNCFISSFLDVKEKKVYTFEISERRNDYLELVAFINDRNKVIVNYGGSDYDNIVYNFIFDNFYVFENASPVLIASEAFRIGRMVFNNEWKELDEIKRKKFFNSIDLKKVILSKEYRVPLKVLQITMKNRDVSDLMVNYNEPIDVSRIDECVNYCKNNAVSIAKLMKMSSEFFKIRSWIKEEYGFECMTLDNVTTGSNFLATKYCEMTGIKLSDFFANKRPFKSFKIEEIVFDFIKFDNEPMNEALEYIKEYSLHSKDDYPSKSILYKGIGLSVGAGGLHSVDRPMIYEETDSMIYIQSDVKSYYPRIIIGHELHDETFEKCFLEVYKEVHSLKVKADEEGDFFRRTFFKFLLNSYWGCLLNEHKPFFNPKIAFTITINGQLMLLMLIQMLTNAGFKVTSVNTDAVEVYLLKERIGEYMSICKEWESLAKVGLTHDFIKKMVRKDCNSSIALYQDGTHESKGDFKYDVVLGKGMSYPIVKKAVTDYFLFDIPVEKTITEHDDILDFCTYLKIDSKFSVEYGNEPVPRINRYFFSKKGRYLYKYKTNKTGKKSYEAIHKGTGVFLLNKLEKNASIKDFDIFYPIYFSKANELINLLDNKQLKIDF